MALQTAWSRAQPGLALVGLGAVAYGCWSLLTRKREANPAELYGPSHRALQAANDTTRLADLLQKMAREEFSPDDRSFIEGASMVFLSTVDANGMPTVSYKGGAPNFVKITGQKELVIPMYDGNGMYLSLGNVSATSKVGLLFIDFDKPKRLRAQGTASVSQAPELLAMFPGAQYAVVVSVASLYVNCGRYIHTRAGLSQHVPNEEGKQPIAGWKRIDVISTSLSEKDRKKVEELGVVGIQSYTGEDEPDMGTLAVQ